MSGKRPITTAIAACAWAAAAHGAGQFIEDIRVSRRGGEAEIAIELACPMRYQSDFALSDGVLLEIRVAPLEGCRQLGAGDGIASEVYRPAGAQLAHLVEVEYEALGLGENLLVLRFDRAVEYRVTQRGDLRTLILTIRDSDSTPDAPPPRRERSRAEPAERALVNRQQKPTRAPLGLRVREPDALADYVVNLQSTREPVEPAALAALDVASGERLYVSPTQVGGATWYRLRLGFFASEEAAQRVRDALAERFPRAWVGRAEPDEVEAAAALEPERGATVAARPPDTAQPAAAAAAPSNAEPLGAERVQAMLADGRSALLNEEYSAAVQIYTRLVEEPGTHRPEVREYLGVAHEKNGEPARARAEYRAYLAEFGGGEGAARVQQRLTGLVTAAAPPREPLRAARVAAAPRWDVATGVAQYYRRAVNQFDEDQPEVVSLSALLSDLDLSVRRSGGRIDLFGRVTVNHLYDLIGEADGGPGDRNRVSYAYLDLEDSARDWSLRLGRQSLHGLGVLGRFDGAHGIYEWTDRRRVHVTAGYPVESTRNSLESDRQFAGVAVDFDELIGAWNLSAFVSDQTIEGIADRRAAGAELRYLDDRRSFTSMVDYDVDYGELNTVLALGTWRLPNRMTLSALVDLRMSPVLTTRNALIGQPVETIEELLLVWSEDEVRQLAVDRTARSRNVTLGVAAPIAERFQINADVTVNEIEATVESAGVPAIPGTGTQTYYSASLVGSGLFASADVMIVNVRHGTSDEFTTSQITWDARFPLGRRLRLNPRLRLAVWDGLLTGRRRETVTPSFKLLFNTHNHYRLELELGNDRFTRTDLTSEQKSAGHFVYLGYRADF